MLMTEKQERAKPNIYDFENRGKRKAWLLSDRRRSRDIRRAEDDFKPQKKMALKTKKERAERRQGLKGEKGTWFWHIECKAAVGDSSVGV